MKWKQAMRVASLAEERWSRKVAEWNPGLETSIRTNRSVGRPRKGWEDEINGFLEGEKKEKKKRNDLKNNDQVDSSNKKSRNMEKKKKKHSR